MPFEHQTIQELPTLNLSCHYFLRVRDRNNKVMDKKVDPKGLLGKAQGRSELYHTISRLVSRQSLAARVPVRQRM